VLTYSTASHYGNFAGSESKLCGWDWRQYPPPDVHTFRLLGTIKFPINPGPRPFPIINNRRRPIKPALFEPGLLLVVSSRRSV